MIWIHPGILTILGSLLIPLIPYKVLRKAYFLSLPIFAFIVLLLTSKGYFGETKFLAWKIYFLEYELILARIDSLSIVFAYVFSIIAICANIYSIHIKNDLEHLAAMIYFGSTLGAIFAGDLFTLYIFWETMAISAVFLIWFRGTASSRKAGFRYLIWHVIGGAFLLTGIVLHVQKTGSIAFTNFVDLINLSPDGFPYVLILIAFMLNAAVVPLHSWLTDSYPEASITGAIYMTAFTTKTAVYALIRGFPGLEILSWFGALMAIYGVVFALIQNDGRRLLSYHIVSQVGYMVCGVGLGSFLALNGAIAHAFCHVLYKGLLFMGMGAVMEMTNRGKFTELGGIYRLMPLTFYLYMIGALSISGVPFFSGFVSKTMTIQASAELNYPLIWILLEGATIGTFVCIALKLPWNVWFGEKRENISANEPHKNMILGMALVAFLCIFFGNYPGYQILYSILPYPAEFEPYKPLKVVKTIEFFIFMAFAFFLFKQKFIGEDKIVLDTDWFGRILGKKFIRFCETGLANISAKLDKNSSYFARKIVDFFTNPERVLFSKSKEFESKIAGYSRQIEVGFGILITLLFMLLYLIFLSF